MNQILCINKTRQPRTPSALAEGTRALPLRGGLPHLTWGRTSEPPGLSNLALDPVESLSILHPIQQALDALRFAIDPSFVIPHHLLMARAPCPIGLVARIVLSGEDERSEECKFDHGLCSS